MAVTLVLYLLLWSANWQLLTGVCVSVNVYCLVDYEYITGTTLSIQDSPWQLKDAELKDAALAVQETAGDLVTPIVGRGAAYADIDADGDLDVIVTQAGDRPLLLRNDQQLGHHWVRLRLKQPGSNPDAIGAWVEIDAGGVTQRRQIMPTRSYLSQVELPVTFGLGSSDQVDEIRIRWPDGMDQVVPGSDVAVDRMMVIPRR